MTESVSHAQYKNPDNDPRGPYVLADITSPHSPKMRPSLAYEWQGYKPPLDRTWRCSEQRLNELESRGAIVFTRGGRPRLKRYLADVRPQKEIPEKTFSICQLEIIVRGTMQGVVNLIARRPDVIAGVEWRDLERAMREVFEALGFETHLTRSGKDGGFDLKLICEDGGTKGSVQAGVDCLMARL